MINEIVIHQWMSKSIDSSSWEKYDDLSIDIINHLFADKSTWINGGLDCLKSACKIRNTINNSFIVGLGFSLKSGANALGINFENLVELGQELDDSPPSLYLFHSNWQDWLEMKEKSCIVQISDVINIEGVETLFLEFISQYDNEYRRSVFFVA